ncbi:hypothetical protein [Prosthecobacter fusiformis]|uniref:hypothetical protein n=1 Tax=Prosthecobacter fusiformis TaxID=48464 RepID=UPI00105DC8E2|nr:hypothetical protein [Prosthecobacter fusiformis]
MLKELAAPAMSYADAQFVPSLRDRPLPPSLLLIPMPYHRPVMQACFALSLHGLAAADAGEYHAAVADACAVSLLAKACHQEPNMLCHLLAITWDTLAIELTWNIFRASPMPLTETDLHHLQKVLSGVNAAESYLQVVRGEMIISLNSFDIMAGDPATRRDFVDKVGTSGVTWVKSIEMVPDSYFILNKATLVEAEMEFLIRPYKAGGLASVLENDHRIQNYLDLSGTSALNLDRYFANAIIPSFHRLAGQTMKTEITLRQAVIACALERFFLAHQSYPASLEELKPVYLQDIPTDLMDGQPMRYSRRPEGRYILWSVGLDKQDDGGEIILEPGKRLAAKNFLLPDYQGDWTWQYSPVTATPMPVGDVPQTLVPVGP